MLSVNLSACTSLQVFDSLRSKQLLADYRRDLALGFFDSVIANSQRVLAEDETRPPADIALYALGEAYAHHAYSGRNYVLSKYYFEKLIKDFPDSPHSSEAQTFVSIYNAFAGQKQGLSNLNARQQAEGEAARKALDSKHFEEAIQINLRILKQSGDRPPADMALFNLGLLYAHIDNPAKDFQKARTFFGRLTGIFPDSHLAEEARIWLGVFETIEKMQKIDQDIEKQKKVLIQ